MAARGGSESLKGVGPKKKIRPEGGGKEQLAVGCQGRRKESSQGERRSKNWRGPREGTIREKNHALVQEEKKRTPLAEGRLSPIKTAEGIYSER